MDIRISSEYITLSQLLKLTSHIDSGGQAKWFLEEHEVYVNGDLERRRGRKIVVGNRVKIQGKTYHCVSDNRQR
jgi:ribosome-associated protein